jgi:HAD superfamily hydrolase (TIGR01509 family)
VIKALLFDLGNVLVAFDFTRGYQAIQKFSRYPAREIPRRIAESGLVPPYERGELSSEQFFERLAGLLCLNMTYQQFCDTWTAIFLPQPLLAEEFLAGLRERYRMVLVSNTNEIHYRMIRETYGVVRQFDAHVLSFEVGAMKPSERIYEEAVRRAGCRPEECFFTDDVPEFVEGARRYGLDAVQFRGVEALQHELRKRGVMV